MGRVAGLRLPFGIQISHFKGIEIQKKSDHPAKATENEAEAHWGGKNLSKTRRGWWAVTGSNRGPPACKAGALTS